MLETCPAGAVNRRRRAAATWWVACVTLACTACTTPAPGRSDVSEVRAIAKVDLGDGDLDLTAPELHARAAQSAPAPAAHTPDSQTTSLLTRIESPSHICMLSNRYFGGRPQVPIDVDAHTYFGCCGGCAKRLFETPEARTARDPVTGQVVDKASAVLAHDAHNRVHYFASEANLVRFGK